MLASLACVLFLQKAQFKKMANSIAVKSVPTVIPRDTATADTRAAPADWF